MKVLRGLAPLGVPRGERPVQPPAGGEVPPAGQAGVHALNLADLLVTELAPEAERERLAEFGRQPGHRAVDGLPELTVLGPSLGRGAGRFHPVQGGGLVDLAVADPLPPEVPAD